MALSFLKIGNKGEAAAAAFLKSNGYRILKTNYRTRFAEIDIVATDEGFLCFIEVKTRQSLKTGLPKESVTPLKQKKILKAATAFLQENDLFDSMVRFDVVEVFADHEKFFCNLIKNAFQAG